MRSSQFAPFQLERDQLELNETVVPAAVLTEPAGWRRTALDLLAA